MAQSHKFTTIKVRDGLRRWLKMEAAERGVPMYELIELLIAKQAKGKRPWDHNGSRRVDSHAG